MAWWDDTEGGRKEIVEDYYMEVRVDAAAGRQPMSRTAFMLARNPGPNTVVYKGRTYNSFYKNADSARRAFSKLESGEIEGTRIYERSKEYEYFDKKKGVYTGPPRGGGEIGLWKMNVVYIYVKDGEEKGPITRSFIVRDPEDRFRSQYDKGRLLVELEDEITMHVEDWTSEDGSDPADDWTILYVEPIKIQRTTKMSQYVVEL